MLRQAQHARMFSRVSSLFPLVLSLSKDSERFFSNLPDVSFWKNRSRAAVFWALALGC